MNENAFTFPPLIKVEPETPEEFHPSAAELFSPRKRTISWNEDVPETPKQTESGSFFSVHSVEPLTKRKLKKNAQKYWMQIAMYVMSGAASHSIRINEIHQKRHDTVQEKDEEKDEEEDDFFAPMQRGRSQTWGGSEHPRRRKISRNIIRPEGPTPYSKRESSGAITIAEDSDEPDEESCEVTTVRLDVLDQRTRCNSWGNTPRPKTANTPRPKTANLKSKPQGTFISTGQSMSNVDKEKGLLSASPPRARCHSWGNSQRPKIQRRITTHEMGPPTSDERKAPLSARSRKISLNLDLPSDRSRQRCNSWGNMDKPTSARSRKISEPAAAHQQRDR